VIAMPNPAVLGLCALALLYLLSGIFVVGPREAHVLIYWGNVSRTVTSPGLHYAFPLGLARNVVSTRDVAFATPITTVVEASGNPIQVSAVCVYRVVDAARALIDVQGYQGFVAQQATAVLKGVCAHFPYESQSHGPSLKKESDEVLEALKSELQSHVARGGVEIVLVRLNDLTYSPEIAQSMLLRQQALAMVDARKTLVEGAIGIVRDGLDTLEREGLHLSLAQREKLASSLTLLLCAGEREPHSTVVTRRS
jgi:regulator of protease activity HflC (stomatin/prohibitin superfamily)